jgi:glycerol-3-phosphate acyltransferase PlsX
MAAEEFGVELLLVGKGESILRALDEMGHKELPAGVEIANATEVVEMEDDPATVTKTKGDSSMTVGLKLLHEGKADAMVSAGSTGALLSGATLITKRIRGIRRGALAPLVPSSNGGFLLVDCGANAECTPEYLLQFAYMGHFYMKELMGRENPKVGLLNIGTEETKGKPLQKETYALLKKASDDGRINFVGNVEARGAMLGDCDVLVTDGFSGNVLLKGIEGVSIFAMGEIKEMFMKNLKTKMAAVAIKDDLKQFKKKFDSSEVGGTMILGISKPVIKAHGSSDAYAIRSAVRQAMNVVDADICGFIERNIEHMKITAPND